ncbi:MAG: DUF4446 family protein [Firmicutes bacterium]|nr:DUF4446 family protein [Bacillota bacterium]
MEQVIEFLNQYSAYFLIGTMSVTLIMTIAAITALAKASRLKKRINSFMKTTEKGQNIEDMLAEYLDKVQWMSDQHDQIINHINNINGRLVHCIQKVGIVRYNPFDEVGGDLCFAIALLDEKNNGTVINSIYSREGCYTYCKPIENGSCERYKLSAEEMESIDRAIEGNAKRNDKK